MEETKHVSVSGCMKGGQHCDSPLDAHLRAEEQLHTISNETKAQKHPTKHKSSFDSLFSHFDMFDFSN